MGLPGATSGKEPACQGRRHKRHRFNLLIGKIPWRRAWQLTPVFLPGESHGQKMLVDYSPWGRKKSDTLATEFYPLLSSFDSIWCAVRLHLMWSLIWFNLGLSYYYIFFFRMRSHLIFLPHLFFFPTIFWVYQICFVHHFKFIWIIYFRKAF